MTKKYQYNDYVKTLTTRFESNLSSIQAEHNFEYGAEFEIAICRTLRSALPDQYGITRGFVVNAQSDTAGDDIVIYQRNRFPTLRLHEREDYSRKENIPIEAAYCYIEAKHTLNLQGSTDSQGLYHAIEQAGKVKQISYTRKDVPNHHIKPYLELSGPLNITPPPDFPQIQNPMFTAIFARQVRNKKGGQLLTDAQDIKKALADFVPPDDSPDPDLIVLGKNAVFLPTILAQEQGKTHHLKSPFFILKRSILTYVPVDGIAAGIALVSLMYALDWIDLGVMPWKQILNDGLNL